MVERLRSCSPPEVEKLVREELGYDFTREEMQQVIFEKHPEMSDEELEAAVGGMPDLETNPALSILCLTLVAA